MELTVHVSLEAKGFSFASGSFWRCFALFLWCIISTLHVLITEQTMVNIGGPYKYNAVK
jgi:hypothetical protein